MTWAQRVRAVFSTPSEFVSPEAEKSDLLLESLEGQAEASVRAEYEPQIQKLRDELAGHREREARQMREQLYASTRKVGPASPHEMFLLRHLANPFGLHTSQVKEIERQLLGDPEVRRAREEVEGWTKPKLEEPETSVAQTVLDSLCSLMTCGADEVLGLVTEYRAAYDRYSVLAERLGVELSHANADAEVTQAFDNLRAREAAYLHILDALGVQNAGDSVIRIDRLKEQVVDVENRNIALRRQNEELLERIAELSKPTVTFKLDASEAIAAIDSASAALNGADTPSEAPSEAEKPPAETDPLRKLDWVEMTQVFRELVKLASVAKVAIPKFNLTNADVRRFAELYADELRLYREASNPQKGGLIQQFSAARRAEEFRPKVLR